ncbi:MAG: DUF378 domain-containing protein [Candidatus Omnitrophica bacterium]|nr:DUF378 domain-containing protein [Candidatus Omnitrophota bacterium]MBI2174100.1 DUF378 domain-containing protein [Candidatus Omnitrophota bacterium]MBI3010564.1 DUF378 domain-containing protein [Candidatus Omnitrophota bacterium]
MSGGKGCCGGCKVVGLLVGLGALNWGVIALAQVDLVAKLFGEMTTMTRVIYGIIGLAGLLKLVSFVKCCPCNKEGSCTPKS